jgi:hypothetical protein
VRFSKRSRSPLCLHNLSDASHLDAAAPLPLGHIPTSTYHLAPANRGRRDGEDDHVQACMMWWVLGSVPMLVDMAGFSSWHGCFWNSGPRPWRHHAVHRLRGMAAQRTCDLWFMVNWTRFRMRFSWTLSMIKDVRFRLGIGCQSGIRCLMLTHCMGKRGIVYTAVFIPLSQMFVANLLRYEHCYYFFRLLFVNYNSYK